MAKVTKIEKGSVIEAGTVMYTVHLKGRESPILVEYRSNKGMPNLRPPFGIIAVHGVCSLSNEQRAIIEAACAMFNSPKAGIGQLKAAVRAYENVKKYRIYKMASGGSTITDWPILFESPLAAAKWAAEKKLADDLGLHEYLEVRDETTENVAKYL